MQATIFYGPPSVGKGTNVEQLLKEFSDLIQIPTGKILRNLLGLKNDMPEIKDHQKYTEMMSFISEKKDFYIKAMSDGEILPDEVSNNIIQLYMQGFPQDAHFIFDGYPRNLGQAVFFDKFLKDHNVSARFLVLEADLPTLILRNEIRRSLEMEPRTDDTPEAFLNRIKIYNETCGPIMDHYARTERLSKIDASDNFEITYQRIKSELFPERLPALPRLTLRSEINPGRNAEMPA